MNGTMMPNEADAASLGDRGFRHLLLTNLLPIVLVLATALLYVLAWWLVGHRRREGVALTAGLFAWMLVAAMLRTSVAWPSLTFAVAGLVAAARAWPAMRIPEPPVFRRIVR